MSARGGAGTAPECAFVRLLPDGRVVVRRAGVEETADVDGVEIVQPGHELLVAIADGLAQARGPVRCSVRSVGPEGRPRVEITFFGWQDKSGDVWLDLAARLIEHGLARPSAVKGP